jgi:iron complex transport system substrate-binding protein
MKTLAAVVAPAVLAALSISTAVLGVPPPRIVSLVPSLTEDLFAIGAGPQVVGVSQFTDYPPAAAALPQVATFASIDAERIVRLHPDVVVGINAQSRLIGDLRRLDIRTTLMNDDGYDDIFKDLAILGRISGHASEASKLAGRLRARTSALVRTVPRDARPRCFVVLGSAPIFTVGDRSFIARLIALAGGRNAATGLRDAYARYSAEALLALQPDVILADKAVGLENVLDRPPWNGLRAVKAGRVYFFDDPDIIERPGPRYNEGLAWLIERLHPHEAGRART